jgi:hypothetical protein
MSDDFQIPGTNQAAPFTLKLHRGEGMVLVAMNWRKGKPPRDLVGFAIEYMEPGGDRFFPLTNRIAFPGAGGEVNPNVLSTRLSPIQKFRWVHFPRNAELPGAFVYRVTPVFMSDSDTLSYGEAQQAAIELRRETYPGEVNVAYTRGFVSSQAFVDRFVSAGPISKLLPANADAGLDFHPTHPKADEALAWMGFEARSAILEVLDQAVADKQADVRVVAYDLNEPQVVSRLEKVGKRLKIIIDDSGTHGKPGSDETKAAKRLGVTAGTANVKRQHVGHLQHNKFIVVDGPGGKLAVFGSTNFSWRGFYVQSNNAIVVRGPKAIAPFAAAFDAYWSDDRPATFGATGSAGSTALGFSDVDATVSFSPHAPANARLATVAKDIGSNTKSSLFYSLAFLYQTPGVVLNAIKKVTANDGIFVYGISDRKVGGLDLQKPGGNVAPVHPAELSKNLPAPFKAEPTGGGGVRMHHKFVVIDFDKPTARVWMGSYNFSTAADTQNGENLVLIRDRRIAVAYTVEALRMFDHYHFRVSQQEARKARKKLQLVKSPRAPGEEPWWAEDYSDPRKVRDRELFA